MQELLRSISKAINTKFNNTIYLTDMEGIERPSFLIYLISGVNTDANYFVTEDNILIQIVYFAPYVKGKLQDRLNQSETVDTLKNIFNKQMTLNTDTYAARVKQLNVGYTTDDDIYLQLQLEIFKFREIDTEVTDNMGNVNINYYGGNE